MKKCVWIFVVLLFAVTAVGDSSTPALRYNQVHQKSSHNSYQREQDLMSQLIFHRLRSIEFDVHIKRFFQQAPAGDWFAYHNTYDNYSNCRLLSDCYGQVAAFHRAAPNHEVITIFYDVNDLAEPGHGRDDFNALIRRELPERSVFTPADLLAACPEAGTLQEAVTLPGCAWPLLEDLRGKFILVASRGDNLEAAGYDLREDLYFIAKSPAGPDPMGQHPNVVFFNMSGPDPFAEKVTAAGLIGRCYWLNEKSDYLAARRKGCQLLATDAIDRIDYPWAATDNDRGWPFAPLDQAADVSKLGSDGDFFSLSSAEGGPDEDQAAYLLELVGASVDGDWSAVIAGPSSKSHREGRGCLIARAGADVDSLFFAVCKAADRKALTVHWREKPGGVSLSRPGRITAGSGVPEEGAVLVRLTVSTNGRCVAGSGSADGLEWTQIERRCFAQPLYRQGLAVFADGPELAEFVFGAVTWESYGQIRCIKKTTL